MDQAAPHSRQSIIEEETGCVTGRGLASNVMTNAGGLFGLCPHYLLGTLDAPIWIPSGSSRAMSISGRSQSSARPRP